MLSSILSSSLWRSVVLISTKNTLGLFALYRIPIGTADSEEMMKAQKHTSHSHLAEKTPQHDMNTVLKLITPQHLLFLPHLRSQVATPSCKVQHVIATIIHIRKIINAVFIVVFPHQSVRQ
jgi:hypothetical protein